MKSQAFVIILSLFLGTGVFASDQARPAANTVTFVRSSQTFGYQSTYQIALADLDDDGDLDAVFSNNEYIGSKVYFNNGKGYFEESKQILTPAGHGACLSDLDRDGDIDLIMTCASEELTSVLYINNGHGIFSDTISVVNDLHLSGLGAHLHDIDCDGDQDLMIDYYHEKNKIYLNEGGGVFSDCKRYYPEDSYWADLDSDGDIDIFVCDEVEKVYKTMLNDGSGDFSEFSSVTDSSLIRGFAAFGDLDNDGDVDVVITNGKRDISYPTKILLNDGAGRFTESRIELSAVNGGKVGIGDLDNDGYQDIVLTGHLMLNQVYMNDGSGGFRRSEFGTTEDGGYMVPLLEDLNGDNYLDIVIPNYITGSNEIWFNMTK